MPLYDFECPHEHRFERLCSMAERENPVPCEGTVNELELDDEIVNRVLADPEAPLPEGFVLVDAGDGGNRLLARVVPCKLQARLIIGKHNNPGGALAHNAAANRDAAREGRYDPANPSRRFMAKGREWRR